MVIHCDSGRVRRGSQTSERPRTQSGDPREAGPRWPGYFQLREAVRCHFGILDVRERDFLSFDGYRLAPSVLSQKFAVAPIAPLRVAGKARDPGVVDPTATGTEPSQGPADGL